MAARIPQLSVQPPINQLRTTIQPLQSLRGQPGGLGGLTPGQAAFNPGQPGPFVGGVLQQPGGLQPSGLQPSGLQPGGSVTGIPTQQFAGQQVPPTGLIGAEQALRGGLTGALGGLQQGLGQARADVGGQVAAGIGALRGSGATGLVQQGVQLLNQGQQQALGQLDVARQRGIGEFEQGIAGLDPVQQNALRQLNIGRQGGEALQQFIQPGQAAQQRQAALSGALGPAAQAAAIREFQTSPGQQFLQQRGEQALLRNQSAVGGLGGGNVLRELQRQGIGFAQQDFENQFNRLGQITGQGLSAAGQSGVLSAQLSGRASDLISGIGRTQAGIRSQQAGQTGQLGLGGANITGDLTRARGSLLGLAAQLEQEGVGQQAGLRGQAAGLLSQQGIVGGTTAADLAFGTGQQVARGRTAAGEQIAGAIGGTTSELADLLNQQGIGISDLTGQAGGTLAELLAGAGAGQAASDQRLAQLLAQILQSSSGQAAGLPGIPGIDETTGALTGIGQAAGGIAGVLEFSDKRLKKSIKRVGITLKGLGLYIWDWTTEGLKVAGNKPTFGVIAQEVQKVIPDAVVMGADGWLRVDYMKVG